MKTEMALTKIRGFFKLNRRLPSYQELADLVGFASKKASYELAKKLIEAGYLEKDSKGRLVPKKLFAPLPNFGLIKAGFPIPAENDLVNTMSFDEFLVDKPEASFILKVSGDSMIEAGIQPGDLVVLEKGRSAKDGDIVVACVDNEWTLKYYMKDQGKVCLVPANKNYPKIFPKESLTIGGIVVSVVRKYN